MFVLAGSHSLFALSSCRHLKDGKYSNTYKMDKNHNNTLLKFKLEISHLKRMWLWIRRTAGKQYVYYCHIADWSSMIFFIAAAVVSINSNYRTASYMKRQKTLFIFCFHWIIFICLRFVFTRTWTQIHECIVYSLSLSSTLDLYLALFSISFLLSSIFHHLHSHPSFFPSQ